MVPANEQDGEKKSKENVILGKQPTDMTFKHNSFKSKIVEKIFLKNNKWFNITVLCFQ